MNIFKNPLTKIIVTEKVNDFPLRSRTKQEYLFLPLVFIIYWSFQSVQSGRKIHETHLDWKARNKTVFFYR